MFNSLTVNYHDLLVWIGHTITLQRWNRKKFKELYVSSIEKRLLQENYHETESFHYQILRLIRHNLVHQTVAIDLLLGLVSMKVSLNGLFY